jgi:ubiquinone/menaquinone biosynthesis C-methylase UbiE
MTEKYYLFDGKNCTTQEIKSLLQKNKLGKREEMVLSMINNPNDNKCIVDLGCLDGFFPKKLTEKFPHSTVIAGDYLEEHLEISRLLYPEAASVYKKLNAYYLDLESESIDILTFQEVIEHLEGAAQAIKEINRVLKIGGELILSTPTAYYGREMWQAFKYELVKKFRKKYLPLSDSIYFQEHEWNRHIYCWTPSTLYTLLKVNGFEYVTHDYCQEGRGWIENFILKIFSFLSPTIIIKVRKVSNASEKII